MLTVNHILSGVTADGWLDTEEATLLLCLAMLTKGPILEVGSYCGRSTMCLAELDRTIYSVDPFDNFHSEWSGDTIAEKFKYNTRRFPKIKQFRMKVEDWEPRPVGFAFLDGDHTFEGTVAQIEKALACKPKFITIHDVNDSGGGAEVKRAAEQLLGEYFIRAGKMAAYKL